jgi:large subunit ribosomal protein L23
MKNPRDIIFRPVITERSTDMMSENKYVFEVDPRSNKTEIKQAIEQIFGVKVVSVNIQNYPGRFKRYGRYSGYTAKRKKAIVTLSPDSKALEFFEGV